MSVFPDFLYRLNAKASVDQQVSIVEEKRVDTVAGVTNFVADLFTVPSDKVLILTHMAIRSQFQGGIGNFVNHRLSHANPSIPGSVVFILKQFENVIAGFGIGLYRGWADWQGVLYCRSGTKLSAIMSCTNADDASIFSSLGGVLIPRSNIVLP